MSDTDRQTVRTVSTEYSGMWIRSRVSVPSDRAPESPNIVRVEVWDREPPNDVQISFSRMALGTTPTCEWKREELASTDETAEVASSLAEDAKTWIDTRHSRDVETMREFENGLSEALEDGEGDD